MLSFISYNPPVYDSFIQYLDLHQLYNLLLTSREIYYSFNEEFGKSLYNKKISVIFDHIRGKTNGEPESKHYRKCFENINFKDILIKISPYNISHFNILDLHYLLCMRRSNSHHKGAQIITYIGEDHTIAKSLSILLYDLTKCIRYHIYPLYTNLEILYIYINRYIDTTSDKYYTLLGQPSFNHMLLFDNMVISQIGRQRRNEILKQDKKYEKLIDL